MHQFLRILFRLAGLETCSYCILLYLLLAFLPWQAFALFQTSLALYEDFLIQLLGRFPAYLESSQSLVAQVILAAAQLA